MPILLGEEAQEAPGGPRRHQEPHEAPEGPRRHQEAPGPQEAPGGPRRPQETPGGPRSPSRPRRPRRPQEAPGGQTVPICLESEQSLCLEAHTAVAVAMAMVLSGWTAWGTQKAQTLFGKKTFFVCLDVA